MTPRNTLIGYMLVLAFITSSVVATGLWVQRIDNGDNGRERG